MLKSGSQLEALSTSMLRDKTSTAGLILAFVIVVVATAMHFVGIQEKNPWYDESATFRVIACVDLHSISGKVLSQSEVMDLLRLDSHNSGIKESLEYNRKNYSDQLPAYFVFLKPFAWLLGSTIGSLRMFSAVCSVLIPPLFFWLVLELTGSKRSALIGTVIISVSPFCMLYACEARNYTFWLLPVLASYIALWRLSSRQSLARTLAAGFLLASAISCHLATALLFPGQVLFLLLQRVKLGTIAVVFSFPILAVLGGLLYKGDYHKVLDRVTTKSWAAMPVEPRFWLNSIEVLLSRVLIDDGQSYKAILAFTILTLLFALGCFFARSMTASRRAFVFAMFSSALILIAMDATMGGLRATVSRYQAVPIITVYLAATLVIESLLSTQRKLLRFCGAALFALVVGCGLWSEWKIANTTNLWNHWQSVDVAKTLPLIVASKHPLLLCCRAEVQLSMAHFVPPHTRFQLIRYGQVTIPPDTDLIVVCCIKGNNRATKLFEELKAKYPGIRVL